MRNLWFIWVWITALFILNVAARAQQIDYNNPNDPYYQISEVSNAPVSVELEEVTPEKIEAAHQLFQTRYAQILQLQEIGQTESPKRNLGPTVSESSRFNLLPWAIAQLLMKAWDVVLEGKPIANLEVKNVSALPVMADYNWAMLTGWQPERVVRSKLRIKNLLGGYPIEMDTAIKLMYGGSARGRGMYIASARVVPSNVHVNWGYNLDVSVNVPSVVNMSGRDDDPIAQITLEVTYKIRSQIAGITIKKSAWTDVFKLQGDGYFLDYSHGQEFFQPVYHTPAPPLPSPSPTPVPTLPTDPAGNDPLFGNNDPFASPSPTPAPKGTSGGGLLPLPTDSPGVTPTATPKPVVKKPAVTPSPSPAARKPAVTPSPTPANKPVRKPA